jgi:hypothetical protein
VILRQERLLLLVINVILKKIKLNQVTGLVELIDMLIFGAVKLIQGIGKI